MSKPNPGEYRDICEFINRNGLAKEFVSAVSGDRTIEQYVSEYPETQDLARNIISDLSAVPGTIK
jgi:hypothetical protein